MNRTLIAILVFILLMLSSVWEMMYLIDTIETLDGSVKEIYEYMEKDKENIDTELNIKMIEQAQKQWDKDKLVLHILLPHNQLNELDYKITSLNRHIHQNDYNMANTAAAAVIKNCEMILNNFLPALENIL